MTMSWSQKTAWVITGAALVAALWVYWRDSVTLDRCTRRCAPDRVEATFLRSWTFSSKYAVCNDGKAFYVVRCDVEPAR